MKRLQSPRQFYSPPNCIATKKQRLKLNRLFTPNLIPCSHVRGDKTTKAYPPLLLLRLISTAEQAHYDDLMAQHHRRGALRRIGQELHYVAVNDGQWIALISFSPAALQCAARDQWIGWHRQHRTERLSLVANNSRFLILVGPVFSHLVRLSA